MLISQTESQISESAGVSDGYGYGGHDDDDVDDDINNPEASRIDYDGCACNSKRDDMEAKVKQVVLFPFAKSKKKKKKKKETRTSSKLPSFSSSGKRVGVGGGVCSSGFCCTRPRTLESPDDSESSDPNDATFTYDMLKALIETNRFYCKECNTHLL